MPAFLRKTPQCRLIRDFERDARADNMASEELNRRKKEMVQELNGFIGLKKAYSAQATQRTELIGGVAAGPSEEEMQGEMDFLNRSAGCVRAPLK
jgi:hypothetical protein